jgi:hypothetical protein
MGKLGYGEVVFNPSFDPLHLLETMYHGKKDLVKTLSQCKKY